MSEIKRMEIKEFRELGLLQEVNRLFLHPMGLALETITNSNSEGSERFCRIRDNRNNPEGMMFADNIIDLEKVKRVKALFEAHRGVRLERFSWHVQPAPGGKPAGDLNTMVAQLLEIVDDLISDICRLCKIVNPQHAHCDSCEQVEKLKGLMLKIDRGLKDDQM